MARLYADENFLLPVVEALRQLGHDVLTMQEAEKAGEALPDETVLALATAEGRAVLTLNRKHFIRLHRQIAAHAGIIVCTFDPDFTGQAERIHELLQPGASLAGHLMRVNRPGPALTGSLHLAVHGLDNLGGSR